MTERCELPPQGWSCTRPAGHPGPCAATVDLPASGAEEPGLRVSFDDLDTSAKDELLRETLEILSLFLRTEIDNHTPLKRTGLLFGRLTYEGVIQ